MPLRYQMDGISSLHFHFILCCQWCKPLNICMPLNTQLHTIKYKKKNTGPSSSTYCICVYVFEIFINTMIGVCGQVCAQRIISAVPMVLMPHEPPTLNKYAQRVFWFHWLPTYSWSVAAIVCSCQINNNTFLRQQACLW